MLLESFGLKYCMVSWYSMSGMVVSGLGLFLSFFR
jgi:hypothetical protein